MSAVEQRIDAMWQRAEDGMDRAVATAKNWEVEKFRIAYQRGFYFALALMHREKKLRDE